MHNTEAMDVYANEAGIEHTTAAFSSGSWVVGAKAACG